MRKKPTTPTAPATRTRWTPPDVTPVVTVSPQLPRLLRAGGHPIFTGLRPRRQTATEGAPWRAIHEGPTRYQRRQRGGRDEDGQALATRTMPATNEPYTR